MWVYTYIQFVCLHSIAYNNVSMACTFFPEIIRSDILEFVSQKNGETGSGAYRRSFSKENYKYELIKIKLNFKYINLKQNITRNRVYRRRSLFGEQSLNSRGGQLHWELEFCRYSASFQSSAVPVQDPIDIPPVCSAFSYQALVLKRATNDFWGWVVPSAFNGVR